jgi:hypothetical protein
MEVRSHLRPCKDGVSQADLDLVRAALDRYHRPRAEPGGVNGPALMPTSQQMDGSAFSQNLKPIAVKIARHNGRSGSASRKRQEFTPRDVPGLRVTLRPRLARA